MINIILCNSLMSKGIKCIGPKALLNINNKPLIIHQIKSIQKSFSHKRYRLHIVLGYQRDKVKKILHKYDLLNKKNILIKEDKNYNDCSQTKIITDILLTLQKEHAIVINEGCIFSNISIPRATSIYNIGKIKKGFDIGCNIRKEQVEYLCYDIPNIWSGITFLHKNDIEQIQNVTLQYLKNKINYIFLFEYINSLIELGIKFEAVKMRYNGIKDAALTYRGKQ